MILLIDNYDSFVYNLARYLARLGQETHVVRNDRIDVEGIRQLCPDAVVLSPGPCTPREAGCSLEVVRRLSGRFPLLGVCLGHQTIAAALGAEIVRARQPMHGRTSVMGHESRGVFAGVPSPMTVCRYHSLVVQESTLPPELRVTARTDDGTVMAIQHTSYPVVGLQFHPEAILTEHGYAVLANFLRLAGLQPPEQLPSRAAELVEAAAVATPLPAGPVTF